MRNLLSLLLAVFCSLPIQKAEADFASDLQAALMFYELAPYFSQLNFTEQETVAGLIYHAGTCTNFSGYLANNGQNVPGPFREYLAVLQLIYDEVCIQGPVQFCAMSEASSTTEVGNIIHWTEDTRQYPEYGSIIETRVIPQLPASIAVAITKATYQAVSFSNYTGLPVPVANGPASAVLPYNTFFLDLFSNNNGQPVFHQRLAVGAANIAQEGSFQSLELTIASNQKFAGAQPLFISPSTTSVLIFDAVSIALEYYEHPVNPSPEVWYFLENQYSQLSQVLSPFRICYQYTT